MAKIGICTPSTRWEVNLMGCTLTIQQTNIINGMKRSIDIGKPKKRAGPIEQGMVKTQLRILEVVKASLCTHICSLNCAMIVGCLSMA